MYYIIMICKLHAYNYLNLLMLLHNQPKISSNVIRLREVLTEKEINEVNMRQKIIAGERNLKK